MTKFYSRRGDDGYTGLLGDKRVPKYAPQPEAYGTIDELSSALGLARATVSDDRSKEIVLDIQRYLYQVMAELAATPEAADRFHQTTAEDVDEVERLTDELGGAVDLHKGFIVPGDSLPGAAIDLARTITRRAERLVAAMVHRGEFHNPEVLRYLNRLSSLLFVLARHEDTVAGAGEWTRAKPDV